jgi:hypothetical protein
MSELSNRLPVLAAEIKIAHAGVKAAAKVAAEHAIEAGLEPKTEEGAGRNGRRRFKRIIAAEAGR